MAYVISDSCVSCGTCEGECPVGAISAGDGKYEIAADTCIECGTCAGACPYRSYQPGIIFVLHSKEAVGFATQLLFEKLAKRVSRSYALICEAMLHLVSIPVSYETASSLSFPLPSGSDESARPVSYSVLPPPHPVPSSDNSFLLIHNPAPVR